jgi:hypothetical protein
MLPCALCNARCVLSVVVVIAGVVVHKLIVNYLLINSLPVLSVAIALVSADAFPAAGYVFLSRSARCLS